nr:protein NYNRIN-like [Tanacetum cinerariifolium]
MVPATTSLTGFSGETTWPLGQLKLLVTIGDATYSTKAWMNFMIVKSLSPYNGIIGRPSTDASILHKPCVTGSGTKLLTNGKAGTIIGLCSKKASKIFSSTSYRGKEVTAIEEEGPTWMTELVNYLKEGTLPEDEKEARKIRLKARQYELIEGILYKRSFLTPWLRCVGPLQAEYVMKEIHEGSCSMHAGPRPLSGRAGESQVPDRCNGLLHEVNRSKSGGNDYRRTNNGKQFAANPFKDWCDKLNITQHFASVKHPQSNRLVERANRSLGEGIKARLGEGNKNWVEELPHVLWAYRMMVKSSHGDMPFSLTYGTEAVIPAEIGMPTYRITVVDVVNNDEELRLNLDFLEEHRKLAAINEARSKSKMTKYYNSRVRGVTFKPGDFVYRSNDASHAAAGGKLGPKWEGPLR